ncbi:MAG: sigma factor G inhibitor Gin [Caldibacillus sp.]
MEEQQKEKRICIICEKEKQEGYSILHSFICTECEQQLIQTEPADPHYQFYVKQLKKIEQVFLPESEVLKSQK